MSRIADKFSNLRHKKKKAFIAFITAGDPDLKSTENLVLAFEKAGVDIIELGVPFSDPLADGKTIQASSQRALKKKVTCEKILKLVKRLRVKTQIPIVLMIYYNQIFHFGEGKFVNEANKSGVDGLIVPDLPPHEASSFIRHAKAKHLDTIFFLSPTTSITRMKSIIKLSKGFIYFLSLTGVTGARKKFSQSIQTPLAIAKKYTNIPLCVGFGISTPAQVKKFANMSDGVIVGSAIINEIARHTGSKDMVSKVAAYVRRLSLAIK